MFGIIWWMNILERKRFSTLFTKDVFFFVSEQALVSVKMKKRKCENIMVKNGRSPFFTRQNLVVHTGIKILVNKSLPKLNVMVTNIAIPMLKLTLFNP